MSLDKAIKHGKEHRKPYRGAAAWDSHCRNNNYCSWCRSNRTHSNSSREYSAIEESLDWEGSTMVPGPSLHCLNDPWEWMDKEGPTPTGETHPYGTWSGLN